MSIEQLEALLDGKGIEDLEADTGRPEEDRETEEEEEGAEAAEKSEEPDETDDEPEEEVFEVDAGLIAEALGIAEEDLFLDDDGKIGIRAKVNGEEIRASLSDLRKSYQLQKNLDDKAHTLNKERAEFQTWQQQQVERFSQEVGIADQMINNQASQLAKQYEAVDWDRLRASDPAEWSARRQEFQQAYESLRGQKERVAEEVQRHQQSMQQQHMAQYEEVLKRELQELFNKLPEWSDPDVANRERQEVAEYLRGVGYADQELNIADHRAIMLARKAMLYDKQASAEPAGKKVRKVRRVMPSGSLTSPKQRSSKIRKERLARQRKTGSEADTLAALEALL